MHTPSERRAKRVLNIRLDLLPRALYGRPAPIALELRGQGEGKAREKRRVVVAKYVIERGREEGKGRKW